MPQVVRTYFVCLAAYSIQCNASWELLDPLIASTLVGLTPVEEVWSC